MEIGLLRALSMVRHLGNYTDTDGGLSGRPALWQRGNDR